MKKTLTLKTLASILLLAVLITAMVFVLVGCSDDKPVESTPAATDPVHVHTWADATCTAPKTCTECQATEGEALGHDFADATCTAPKTCKVCAATDGEALGHTEEVVPGKAATCTEKGLTDGKKCSVCDTVIAEQTEIPALGHTEVVLDAVAPTCTATGLTAGKKCSVCNEILEAQTEVAALGHTWVDATCTAPKTCSACQATEGEALGHTEVEIPAVAPTCTATGLTAGKKCSVCETVTVAQETVAALGHTEVEIPAVAPTCTEAGLTAGKKCSVCDTVTVAQQTVAALGHTEVVVTGTPATCTTAGLTDGKTCSVCNAVLVAQTEIAALGHTEVVIPAVAPTCTETGLTEGKKCSTCDTVLVAQEEVAALGHTEATVAGTAATCTTAGKTDTVYCTVCETIITASTEIPALGHTNVDVPAVAPTCTETGLTAGVKCSVCDTVITAQETVEALGHTEVAVAGTPATCTTNGLSDGKKCSVCDAITVAQTEIKATGHNEVDLPAVVATCTTAGKTAGKKCTTCGEVTVAQEDVAALGHTEVVVAGTPATCTTAGLTDGKKCSVCGTVTKAQTEIAALGHTKVELPAVAATCTTAGKTAGEKCETCGEILKAQTEVPAKGHTPGEAATCTTAQTCTVCNAELVAALGHTEVVLPGVDATCTTAGKTAGKKCSVCGEVIVAQETVEALGHTEVTVAGTPATCTAAGITDGKKCSVCGVVTVAQETIAALGHTEETLAAVAPSCTETGLTEGKKCSVCQTVLIKQETVAKAAHTYDNDQDADCNKCGFTRDVECQHTNTTKTVAKAPTCTAPGWTEGEVCNDCEEVLKESTSIAALGHTEAELPAVAATCTTAGKTAGKQCSVCQTITVAQTEIPAKGHTPGAAATCTTAQTCTVCSTELVAALGHIEVVLPAVAPTCTTAGKTAGKECSRCDEVLVAQETVDALGHTEVTVAGTPATCTAAGITDGKKCSVCGVVTVAQETIDALGHTEAELPAVAATCTTAGKTAGKQCSVCQTIIVAQTEIAALGHTPGAAATCTTAQTCTVCRTELVAALGHTEEILAAVAAKCGVKGKTEGKYCTRCQTTTVPQVETDALEHIWGPVTTDTAATCSTPGQTSKHCTREGCTGQTEVTVVNAFGHTMSTATCTVPSTCSTCGHVEGTTAPHTLGSATCTAPATCGVCGATEGTALGHDTVAATCTEVEYCKRCDYKGTEVLGHDYADATCTAPKTCKREGCGATYGDPLGHLEGTVLGTEATCTETGLTDGKQCTRCLTVTTAQTTIPAKGHSFDATAKCTVCNVQLTEAGLYDKFGNQIATWEALLNDGFDITKDYDFDAKEYKNEGSMSGYEFIGKNNAPYKSAAVLIIAEGVTEIGDAVFAECKNLKAIVLPSTLTSIGRQAFSGGTFTSIIIPAGVTEIAFRAFNECTPLASLIYNGTGAQWIAINKANGWNNGTNNLKNITTSDKAGLCLACTLTSTTEASTCAVAGKTTYTCSICQYSYFVELPKSEDHNYGNATCTEAATCSVCGAVSESAIGHSYNEFYECTREGCTFVAPAGLYNGELDKFNPTPNVSWDTLVNTDKLDITKDYQLDSEDPEEDRYKIHASSGYNVLNKYTEGTILVIPTDDNITKVGKNALRGLTYIKKIVIRSGVITTGQYSLVACEALEAIILPEGLTTLGTQTFKNCTKLTSIVIPSTVTNINSSVFDGCTSLKEMTFKGAIPTLGSTDPFKNCTDVHVILLGGQLNKKFAGKTFFSKLTIGAGVTYDAAESSNKSTSAFANCTGLQKLVIDSDRVMYGSFSGCTNLVSVTLSASVTKIQGNAFQGCTSLVSINIPADVTTIGTSTFEGCTSLMNVSFAGNVADFEQFAVSFKASTGVPTCKITCADGVLQMAHKYDGGKVTTTPGCTTTGVNTFTCSCGDTYTETIEATGHTPVTDKAVAPGCTTTGKTEGSHCDICSTVITPQTVIDATGHDWTTATCTTDAVCQNGCGTAGQAALGHNLTNIEVVQPSCMTDGYTTKTCSRCDYFETTDPTPAYGSHGNIVDGKCVRCGVEVHTCNFVEIADAAAMKTAATCAAPAEYYKTCETCRAKSNETFRAGETLPHTIVNANCEKATHCSTCGMEYGKPLSHVFAWVDGAVKCTNAGCTKTLEAGLYDANGNRIATWAELVSAGFKISTDYPGSGTTDGTNYLDSPNSGKNIFGSDAYKNGKILVISSEVTELGDRSFAETTTLTHIYIPSSITAIANRMFYACSALKGVYMDGAVTLIDEFAFYNCEALTSVTIPGTVTNIGNSAFNGCNALTGLTFNGTKAAWSAVTKGSNWKSNTKICAITCNDGIDAAHSISSSSRTCSYCGETLAAGLYSASGELLVTWAELTTAGVDVTKDYTGSSDTNRPSAVLADKYPTGKILVIPESVTTIGAYAFYGNSDGSSSGAASTLTKIVLSSQTTTLGASAFAGAGNITEMYLPETVTALPDKLFNGSKAITKITIAGEITSSGKAVFRMCSKLKTLTFAGGENFVLPNISAIGDGSNTETGMGYFDQVKTFSTVTIPVSVTSIGARTFYKNTALTTVYYEGTIAQWNAITKQAAWAAGCTKLTKIVCTDGVICTKPGSSTGNTSTREHAFTDGVCDNCGCTTCENGSHNFGEGTTCTLCQKDKCAALGHTYGEGTVCTVCSIQKCAAGDAEHVFAAATCAKPATCVCGATKGSPLATHDGTNAECAVCQEMSNIKISDSENLKDRLDALENNNSLSVRDEIVEFMKIQLSFAYKADGTKAPETNYSYYIKNLFSYKEYGDKTDVEKTKYTIENGKYYGGIPYTGNASGNPYRWLYFYDQTTGVMDLAPIINSSIYGASRVDVVYDDYQNATFPYIGSAIFGNSCSSSVFWAWARVSNSLNGTWTSSWLPTNGYVKVGDYELVLTNSGAIDWDKTIKGSLGGILPARNDKQTMYESYAQMLKADGLLQDGHAIMIVDNPVIVYNEDGSINGAESYVMIAEQIAAWLQKDANGNDVADTTFHSNLASGQEYHIMSRLPGISTTKYEGTMTSLDEKVRYSFEKLYNDGFIPFTTPELAGLKEIDEATITVTGVKNADTITMAQLAKVKVESNYYVSDLGVTVKDAQGNVVFTAAFATNSANVYKTATVSNLLTQNVMYSSKTYIKDQLNNYFADGTYTLIIDCRVSTGEVLNVFTGTLTK